MIPIGLHGGDLLCFLIDFYGQPTVGFANAAVRSLRDGHADSLSWPEDTSAFLECLSLGAKNAEFEKLDAQTGEVTARGWALGQPTLDGV